MAEWIITCNMSYYDVVGAFKKLDVINWKQSVNIEVGNIVYIYAAKPLSAIKYKCKVTKSDLTSTSIDDSEFVLDGTNYENYGRYMELQQMSTFNNELLGYYYLKENGLKSVQGPSKVTSQLSNYIHRVTAKLDPEFDLLGANEVEDNSLVDDLRKLVIIKPKLAYKYKGKSREKKEPVYSNGRKTYQRDRQIALNAFSHANYECEIDIEHPTFKRKKTDVNYTEPHHLVPIAYSDRFDVSLDIEENIVSLCSNCHNQLHYGQGAEELLWQLYNERREDLERAGIIITIKELLEMY